MPHKDPAVRKAYRERYYRINSKKIIEQVRRRSIERRDEIAEYRKRHYTIHNERIRRRQKAYYQKHRLEILALRKASGNKQSNQWRKEHPERHKAMASKYWASEKGKAQSKKARAIRRAKIGSAPHTLTLH